MTEYNKSAEGQFTSTGVGEFINLPFIPQMVEMWNLTASGTTTNHLVTSAVGFNVSAAGTAYTTAYNATAESMTKVITSGGFSFISAGTYAYGPKLTISSITQASPAVVTTSANHNLVTGDAVLIGGTTGMLQIAGEVYTVTVTGATTFTINVNSSGFAAAATAGFAKKVLYPDLYVPYGCVITGVTTGATTVLTLGLNHGFVVGQEVYIQIPSATSYTWGTTQLDTLTYNSLNVVPQQAYVTAITASTITININSTSFTAFAYPTSAQAALGMSFPMVFAIGDQNSGMSGILAIPPVALPITIPGAFYANTRQGFLIGTGDGTTIMHATNDVIQWRASYPDIYIPS